MKAAPLLALAASMLVTGCGYGELTAIGERRAAPETCGGCHVEVYREWASSAHATAFSGPTYEQVTADHDFDGCAGCHVPDSIYGDGPVSPRSAGLAHGVDCVACHLDGGVLVGPFEESGLVRPHPVRDDRPIYLRSDLCGRCHEGTFREWSAAPPQGPDGAEKRTCQSCHMPAVDRTLTQATGALSSILVATESEHPQRRHRFDLEVVRGFEGAVDLSLEGGPDSLDVVVANRLPHGLPTGDFGPRNVEARITFRGEDGSELGRATQSYRARLRTHVPAYGTARRRIPAPEGTRLAEVVLVRLASPTTDEFELARAAWRHP